jgi:hypothetical protein
MATFTLGNCTLSMKNSMAWIHAVALSRNSFESLLNCEGKQAAVWKAVNLVIERSAIRRFDLALTSPDGNLGSYPLSCLSRLQGQQEVAIPFRPAEVKPNNFRKASLFVIDSVKVIEKIGAENRDRTGDVQLGKLNVN